jgi:hypothetical protein
MKKWYPIFLFLTILFVPVVCNSQSNHLFPIKKGWIKADGKEIILSYADSTFHSSNGMARFISKGKYGFINGKGFEIAKPQYEMLTPFSEGKAFAKKDLRWFAIDTNGKELFTVLCNYIYPFSEGLARFQLGNKFGYIDLQGKAVITAQFQGAYDFNDGLARVYQNGKWGFIDKSGTLKIAANFDYVWDFKNGRAAVMKMEQNVEKWGYIDVTGKLVIPYFEGYAFPFNENNALVRIGAYRTGKLALIGKDGKQSFAIPYADVYYCENGLLNVVIQQNGKEQWGYIDALGNTIIEFLFDASAQFNNGLALVYINSKMNYINEKGVVIWKEL